MKAQENEFCNQHMAVGIIDKNGVPICEGDKVKTNAAWELGSDGQIATCVYSQKNAAFGLEVDYLGATRFFAFCQMCNIEYEVIKNE